MPRPKSDLKSYQFKLSEADYRLLEMIAAKCDPPTRAEAIRVAIRAKAADLGIAEPQRKRGSK